MLPPPDMAKKVFVSYCHKQGPWVWERLVPILRAAGCADVLVDRERFLAGRRVKGQMDATQDQADGDPAPWALMLTESR